MCSISYAEQPTKPPFNSFLAESVYPVAHYRGNRNDVAGPAGPSRRLQSDEWQWQPVGPINSYPPTYSGTYPDGSYVIWVSGNDRVAKLDGKTLEVLSEYRLEDRVYYRSEKVITDVKSLDSFDQYSQPQELVDKYWELVAPAWPSVGSAYKLLSSENELFLPYRLKDGSMTIRVYGETDNTNPASDIEFRREWRIPPEITKARLFGQHMTSDGHFVMVTGDGTVIALTRDFSKHFILRLPTLDGSRPAGDLFLSFVKNGLAADDQNGIYVVTRDHMHRVQWTGEKLSIDGVDGGWSAPYPNENGKGSGSTPALMGWGPDEDHLVVITDGSNRNKAMVFWRDAIPTSWKALPSYDRRVAGVADIAEGLAPDTVMETENTAIVYGYGAFLVNTKPVKPMPNQGSPTKQWMAENLFINISGHEALGGSKVQWNPKKQQLEIVWRSQANFGGTVCTVSDKNNTLYCMGAQEGEWTLEATDWYSGENLFHYILGKSVRFNPFGGPLIITPAGDIDCACMGGFGLLRIQPSTKK